VAHGRATKQLLILGAIAGPFYVGVALLQMAIREGFDIRRHPLSLMSNGELGWIQIANFLITGALVVTGAAGVKQAVRSGRGRTWAPIMLGLYGIGLIGAGIFRSDPALGFPPGTPATNNAISTHGILHFVFGAIGFAGLIAVCLIFARRFSDLGQRGWSMFSLAVVLSFAWLSLVLTKTGHE